MEYIFLKSSNTRLQRDDLLNSLAETNYKFIRRILQ